MNKYLIDFKYSYTNMYADKWYREKQLLQSKMHAWLIENIDCVEAFPHWQFKQGALYYSTPTVGDEVHDFIEIHDGVFIYDDAARVAFKLRFGV